jgi:hypothetical protein
VGDWECRAIFEGTELEPGAPAGIELTDHVLAATANRLGLVVH